MTTKNRTRDMILLVLFFVVIVISLSWIIIVEKNRNINTIKIGDVAPQTFRSPKIITYESKVNTEERKEQARNEVEIIPTIDQTAREKQLEIVQKTKEQVVAIINTDDTESIQQQKIKQVFENSITDEEAKSIIDEKDNIQKIFNEVEILLNTIQEDEQFTKDALPDIQEQVSSKINPNLTSNEFANVRIIAETLLISNSVLDEGKKTTKAEEAAKDVKTVLYQIKKDEIIVAKGELVTEENFEKLEASGLTTATPNLQEKIGLIGFIALATLLLLFYVKTLSETSVHQAALYSLVAISVITLSFAAQFFLPIKPIILYMLPVAAPAVVISIVAGARVGVLVAIYLATMVGLASGASFEITVIHIVTSLFTIFFLQNIQQIKEILKALIAIAIIQSLLAVLFHFLADVITIEKTASLIIASVAFSGITIIVIIGLLILTSYFFNIATFPALLDLASPNSTILRKLSIEAPGTYHHSLIVGALSEQAAKTIGADPLLSKVGAYYHDIGKLNNPQYYIENSGENHHDEDPKNAAKKIISHVSHGLKLASKHKLPKEIKQIIAEHHGTSTVSFFLNKAKNPNIEDFRYPGPKPQTKESVIIMLADSVEAFVRSKSKNETIDLSQAIETMVKQKLEDKQLDESPITLAELSSIKKSFKLVLKGVYHERIKY